MFHEYTGDPAAVEPGWARVFGDLDDTARSWLAGSEGPGTAAPPRESGASVDTLAAARDSMNALRMIRAYRVRGHLEANLDPLGLMACDPHPDLAPETYGFSESDMDREVYVGGQVGLEWATPRQILEVLRKIYCSTIGIEFMHLQHPEQRIWIEDHVENIVRRSLLRPEAKLDILERLTAAETFEKFLDKKYTGTKRFGLDGGESAIPALETIARVAVKVGIEEIVIGMPHRGRLNVLTNLMAKPCAAIFSEFLGGASTPEEVGGSGDVKYHLGTSTDREIDGKPLHLSLTPNPSHLEAVNPVVMGKVRARQEQLGDTERGRCMGLLMHGDAAFAGQGIVAESLQFSEVEGYRVGGMMHLIVNNQIGFTTNPMEIRTSPYCSDAAKAIQAPIVHVNGDDPEAVVLAAAFALEFRQAFKRDVVIDMLCYRRHGHNEGDEPAFTQPKMYAKIREHPSTREIYARQLIQEGVLSEADAEAMVKERRRLLEQEFEAGKTYKPNKADWLEGTWSGLEPVQGYDAHRGLSEVPLDSLRAVGEALVTVPESVEINRKIQRQLKTKRKMFESGEGIDWATAEALAFGTLLLEGRPVRLSGEDSGRGTFSQRHAVWIDQKTEERYVPLNHIREPQETFQVLDSPLSEFGVLGFEYGYAMAEPRGLTLWEGQFGDFANGAQVIIDQFIAAGESKWLRMSGLALLLPHGYEGQGPEHSSARLERFLQLCAEDNMQVVNLTTPASYFHVLRRQLHRDFRKPLIVMSPKSLLRHKLVASRLDEMGKETTFHRLLHEDVLPNEPGQARQLVMCSGKVYYDLLAEREERGIDDVHLLRFEQLYPFPADALSVVLDRYRGCHLVWCQEEPLNMGAWSYIANLIEEVAQDVGCEHPRPRCAGRPTSASPATGVHRRHLAKQARLVDEALTVGLKRQGRLAARRPGRRTRC